MVTEQPSLVNCWFAPWAENWAAVVPAPSPLFCFTLPMLFCGHHSFRATDLVIPLLPPSFEFHFITKYIYLLFPPNHEFFFYRICFYILYCLSWPSMLVSGDVSNEWKRGKPCFIDFRSSLAFSFNYTRELCHLKKPHDKVWGFFGGKKFIDPNSSTFCVIFNFTRHCILCLPAPLPYV